MPVSFLLALGLGVIANAQYLISTKAGFVNRVEGEVYVLRADGEDGEKGRASLGTQMLAGDRLSVAASGFAETLLNPGSYLRLSENTEVRAVSVDLDSVRFELIKGSVIAEIGQIDKKAPIEIITPQGALTIAKAGLHRIDAKGSATLVAVRQGEIHLGTRSDFAANQSLKIKRGKVVTLTGSALPGQSDVAKLDKDAVDKFDIWSFNRAQALTEANVKALSRSGVLTAGWYYDPFDRFYTFVPSRSWFWSPYGFGFFNNYRDCYDYTPYYYSRSYNRSQGTSASGATSARASGASVPARVMSGNDRGAVSRATDRRSADTGFGSRSDGFGDSGRSRGSSSSPSTSSPRATSAPGASRGPSGPRGGGDGMPSRRSGPIR
ncbi:MAG TPA: FecR family protein [Blastocatellia bacterium]|nr:FecR family protein [Blastocatellia bacterium]